MIPPFVIPKRSPSFISKSEQGRNHTRALAACMPLSTRLPLVAYMITLILIPLCIDKHPSLGSTTLLPAGSLHSLIPESYGAAPEAGLRAENIANAELCLVRNMIVTYRIQRSRGIYS